MEVNDIKAMRDALNRARRTLCRWKIDAPLSAWNEFDLAIDEINAALSAPARNCDVMSIETAKKVWFAKEIVPRLNGDLPLVKEIPFEEWFVSQQEQGESK